MNSGQKITNFIFNIICMLFICSSLLLTVSATQPVNSVFSGAIVVSPSESLSFNNSGSPANAQLNECSALQIASAYMWYKIEPISYDRTITVDTCLTQFDSVLALLSGTSQSSLNVIACNDNRTDANQSCFAGSSLISAATISAEETAYIVFGGVLSNSVPATGNAFMNVTLNSITDVSCYVDLLVDMQTSLSSSVQSLSSAIQSSIDQTNSDLSSSITSHSSSIQSLISSSF